MSTWTVYGADRSTGNDKTIQVTAATADEARRAAEAAGLLIESVEPSLAIAAENPDPQVDFVPDYRRPTSRNTPLPLPNVPPSYTPLLLLSRVMTCLAILGYVMVGGIVVVGVGTLITAGVRGGTFVSALGSSVSVLALLVWAMSSLLGALFIHAFGASLAALRDIARSVYRPI